MLRTCALPAFAIVTTLTALSACSDTGNSSGSGGPWTIPPGDSVGAGGDVTPTADTGGGGGGDGGTAGDSGATGDADPSDSGATGDDSIIDAGPTGPSCAKATACKPYPDTPYCDLQAQVCVACLVDNHCKDAGGSCKNGTCVEISCKPGTSECQGNFLATCKPDGKGYDVVSCPSEAPICVGGTCAYCKPGEVSCAAPPVPGGLSPAVQKCKDDGQDADIIQVCPGGQSCFAGVCSACVPGSKRCSGHAAEECNETGSGWNVLQDCGAKALTCLAGVCVNPCDSDYKSNTNVGCDYWAVDLDNAVDTGGGKTYDAQNAQFSIIVSNTATSDAVVTVTLGPDPKAAGAKSKQWTVPAKKLQVINLPDKAWGVPNQNQEGSGVNDRIYRIQATQPIVAYQFNPLQNYGVFSNDASLLLPTSSLGQEYWVASRNQLSTKFRSYFNVIATQPGETKVTVVVSAPTVAGVGVAKMSLGSKMTFALQQGQALNVESDKEDADLTGSWISADHPVAVFGGSEASNSPQVGNCVPMSKGSSSKVCASTVLGGGFGAKSCSKDADCESECCADHLEEQLFPVKSWGTSYVGARLSPRGKELDAWRVVAAENNTKVTLTPNIGIQVPTLHQGQHFEFQTTADFLLESDKPVMLVQYMASSYATVTVAQATCSSDASCLSQYGFLATCEAGGIQKYCAPLGDPSMILDVATTQFLDDYLFLVPDKYKLNYITIVAPAGATVSLDGTPLLNSGFAAIPGTQWTVARLPIAAGTHALQATAKIGLFVYGYDDDVSYGYPGGAGL